MKKILIAVLIGVAFTACGQPNTKPSSSFKPVGTPFTIVFDGLGTANFTASLSSTLKTQAFTDQQATVTPIRVVARGSLDFVPNGEPRSSGFRYVYAVVSVNSTDNLENVSFLGVRSSSSIADTAISAAIRAPGGVAFSPSELEALALGVKPAQPVSYNSVTKSLVPLPNTEDTVQYLPESALDYVPNGMNGLLPYGFTVLNSTGGRTLETTSNANRMIVGMKVPLAANPINDPYAFAFSAVPISDSVTRVTQSLEAQTPEGSAAVVARAATLGSQTSITVLPSVQPSLASANPVNALCSLRTAGSASQPTGYLINRTFLASHLAANITIITKGQKLASSVRVNLNGGYYVPAQIIAANPNLLHMTGGLLEALEAGETSITSNACGSSITSSVRIQKATTFDGGDFHSLAIKSDGQVIAWGDNFYGEASVPNNLTDVISVSAGGPHSLALKSNGTVIAWGYNRFGQTTIPNNLSNVVAISAGGYQSLALKSDGTVVAWGNNNFGQSNVPPDLTKMIGVSGGDFHSLALKSDGTMVAWGNNDQGQTNIPSSITAVQSIRAGHGRHNLVLQNDNTVKAWGNNEFGQLDIPNPLDNVIAIAAGTDHNLVLKADGSLVLWGDNTYDQLNAPSNITNVVAIAAGAFHNLALQADGKMLVFGSNLFEQLELPNIGSLTFKLP